MEPVVVEVQAASDHCLFPFLWTRLLVVVARRTAHLQELLYWVQEVEPPGLVRLEAGLLLQLVRVPTHPGNDPLPNVLWWKRCHVDGVP
jgi:hypothetical protein